MEIKIQFQNRIYVIQFGYRTQWFESLSFITIIREYYGYDMQLEFAEMIWHS